MEESYKTVNGANCPVLKKQPLSRCLCCSVKTGSLIIGYFHVVICVLLIPFIIAAMIMINSSSSMLNKPQKFADDDIQVRTGDDLRTLKEGKIVPAVIQVGLALIFFLVVMVLLLHLLLLIGIYKKRPSILTAYVICFSCVMCLRVLGIGSSLAQKEPLSAIFMEISSIGVGLVGIITVYSYKVQLNNETLMKTSHCYNENAANNFEAPPPYSPYYSA